MKNSSPNVLQFLGSAKAILAGIFLGAVLGFLMGPAAQGLKPIGFVFISLLKLIVLPLIFSSIVVGVFRTGTFARLGRLGGKTLLYYFTTTSIAIALGLFLVNALKPGAGIVLEGSESMPEAAPVRSALDFLVRLVPENIFAALSEMNILGVIMFAMMFGVALLVSGEKASPIVKLMTALEEVFLLMTRGVILLAPVGVIGLVAPLVGTFGAGVFISLSKFVLVVLLGVLVHGCVVLPAILAWFSGRSPLEYLRQVQTALLSAFVTSSSSATLPVSIESARRAGIRDETSGFVLPLGATVNMDGTALYEAVIAVFIAQSIGVELTVAQQFIIFATAMLASVGAAGIPSAGLVTILLVLEAVGLPAVGIGLLFAVDRPLDMCRTTVNVWGDLVGCAVVEGKQPVKRMDRHGG